MFKFPFKKSKKAASAQAEGVAESNRQLAKGLLKTRHKWVGGLASLILGKKTIEPALLKEIETCLLTSDVGVKCTKEIIAHLTEGLTRNQLDKPQQVLDYLKTHLKALLLPAQQPLTLSDSSPSPYVILMVGVNGTGKTTTIGKLASRLQSQGKRVLLAAGDTFRAAAVEQLKAWGKAHDVPVIAQGQGADSASVSFDALQAAQARGIHVLLVDTAGRLHTKDNLMEELKKVKRVMAKLDVEAPHEVLLVLDATTGQNGLRQAQAFQEAVEVTGLVLTKLDGTAKGGIIFSIVEALGLPIRFIGVGESSADLKPFDANAFVDALFNDVV